MKPLTWHSEVWAEFDESADYYERQRPGLGATFRAAVEDAFQRIQQMPRLFPPLAGSSYRKCFVKKFRYTVYFLERDHDIWIAAVAHQKRRQGYWMNRSPDDP